MATNREDITREIEETYPLTLRFFLTEEQAASLSYASLADFVDQIVAATVQLQVPSLPATVAATISAELVGGVEAAITLTFALPPSITDAAATRAYHIILEPGSPVSERVLCQGSLVIRPRITA